MAGDNRRSFRLQRGGLGASGQSRETHSRGTVMRDHESGEGDRVVLGPQAIEDLKAMNLSERYWCSELRWELSSEDWNPSGCNGRKFLLEHKVRPVYVYVEVVDTLFVIVRAFRGAPTKE